MITAKLTLAAKLSLTGVLAAAAAGVLGGSAPAQAAVAFSYAAEQSSYSALPGSTVAVNLYLVETLTGSDDFIAANGGISAAGTAVSFSSAGVIGSPASFTASSFTPAAPFVDPGHGITAYNTAGDDGLEVSLVGSGGSNAEPTATSTGERVQIGTLNITVGTAATTFNVSSINNDTIPGGGGGGGDGFTTTALPTGSGIDLDITGKPDFIGADAAAAYSFTVSPVPTPEPTSLALLALGGLTTLRRRRA